METTAHRLAAKQAVEETRWDDAVREYEEALSLLASGEATGEDEVALLTGLGTCYWNLAEARTAWRTLRRAIALARDRDDGVAMARATVEALRIWGPPERHRAMADEALGALGDADPHLRALLLLRRARFSERDDPGVAEALAIADQYGFEDLQTIHVDRKAWTAIEAGRIDEGLAHVQSAHEAYARLRVYEPAGGVLRGAGFNILGQGHLDRGAELAAQAVAYARKVHLRFNEQLALLDVVGEAFARCDFNRCRALLSELPGQLDFRGDLFDLWMLELSGDVEAAARRVINPQRGGGAPGALSQTHGANAGVLFHAGRLDGARRELDAWLAVSGRGESICEELPAVGDCLVELAGDDVLRDVYAALEKDFALPAPTVYCTLQGRALAPARGAVALKLGLLDKAELAYRAGLQWCERERVPLDAGLCHVGLADVALARGDHEASGQHLRLAESIFDEYAAQLWLDRLIGPRRARAN